MSSPELPVEPWTVREVGLDLTALGQTESLFALSNGHIGMRANLDEGEPSHLPGTYLNSFFELRPLPYAEAGYGFPEQGQTIINVTDGKLLRLLVDDEPFDVRYGSLESHERVLDLRAGTLRRSAEWTSPAGKRIGVESTRLVSFAHRSIAAIAYEVHARDSEVRCTVQSELVANQKPPRTPRDPRVAAVLKRPLESEEHLASGTNVRLIHRTNKSKLRMAAMMEHEITGPDSLTVSSEAEPDTGRVTVTVTLAPGETLRIVKFLAYGWSSQRSLPAVRAQVAAGLTSAKATGWEGLQKLQRAYLDAFWACADVQLDGDPEIQQAVRFALFHVLQAGARTERRAIAAKGLTGPGYDGHAFWDTETFVLPLLTYTHSIGAGDALRWRHSTLDLARERAQTLGLAGAAFPWRTIRGQECSGYWPAGTAAFHVGADIADAVVRYTDATGDDDFERDIGLDLLVETARLWVSLGYHAPRDGFRIDGVTGPDEYSAVADNNVFTNLMAQRNLREAVEVCRRHPETAEQRGVTDGEMQAWRAAADKMHVPWEPALNVHPQSEGFTDHDVWPFESTPAEHYPLLLNAPYFDLYRKQVVKQADLVLAMHLRSDAFSQEEKRANFAYYEALTVRDSSLSAATQSVVAADVGHLELAYDYLREAALTDLRDLHANARDGLHMASLAGAWLALVAGFGGLRDFDRTLRLAPRLPQRLTRMAFTVDWRGSRLGVEVIRENEDDGGPGAKSSQWVTYTHVDGPAVEFQHEGRTLTLDDGAQQTVAVELPDPGPEPVQPAGRAPERSYRRPGAR